jgi:hypothetical protein
MSPFNARAALRRRWYIGLVGLLLTLGAVIMVARIVPAQTELTGSVLLLPPRVQSTTESATPTNPYLQLGGLDTVVGLVARALSTPSKLESMAEQGATGQVKVEPAPTMPGAVVMVTVDGVTPEEADRTLEVVLSAVPQVLAEMQAQVSTPTKSFITASVVDKDTQGHVVRKDQYRAMLVVGGGGAAGTILLTTLVDLIILRRRPEGDAGGDEQESLARVPVAPTWPGGSAPRPAAPAQPGLFVGFDRSPQQSPYSADPPMAGRTVGQVASSLPTAVNGGSGATGTSAPHAPAGQPAARRLGSPLPRRDAPPEDVGGIRPTLAGHGRLVGRAPLILPDRLMHDASARGAFGAGGDLNDRDPMPEAAARPVSGRNGHPVIQLRPEMPDGPASAERLRTADEVVPGPLSDAPRTGSPDAEVAGPSVIGLASPGVRPAGHGASAAAEPGVAVPGLGEADSGNWPQGGQAAASPVRVRHPSASAPASVPNAVGGSQVGPSLVQSAAETANTESRAANVDPAAVAGPPTGGFERLLRPKKPTPQDPDPRASAHRLPWAR